MRSIWKCLLPLELFVKKWGASLCLLHTNSIGKVESEFRQLNIRSNLCIDESTLSSSAECLHPPYQNLADTEGFFLCAWSCLRNFYHPPPGALCRYNDPHPQPLLLTVRASNCGMERYHDILKGLSYTVTCFFTFRSGTENLDTFHNSQLLYKNPKILKATFSPSHLSKSRKNCRGKHKKTPLYSLWLGWFQPLLWVLWRLSFVWLQYWSFRKVLRYWIWKQKCVSLSPALTWSPLAGTAVRVLQVVVVKNAFMSI